MSTPICSPRLSNRSLVFLLLALITQAKQYKAPFENHSPNHSFTWLFLKLIVPDFHSFLKKQIHNQALKFDHNHF